MNTKKIGVFGHYGNKNLGDEAIIEATIQNLRARIPGVELVGLSINPADTAQRYGIPSFPIRYREAFFQSDSQQHTNQASANTTSKPEPITDAEPVSHTPAQRSLPVRIVRGIASRLVNGSIKLIREIQFLRACSRQLRDMDLLIVCGSNQFLDNFGGAWGFPYTLMKWTLLAKKNNTKVAFASIGAGPLNGKLSFWMIKQALIRADYISYRDAGSKALIEERIKEIEAPVYPDLAHSLLNTPQRSGEPSGKVVALNPMPVFDPRYWPVINPQKREHYVAAMSNFAAKQIESGATVILFNTQVKDLDTIQDIRNHLQAHHTAVANSEQLLTVENNTLQELLETLTRADFVVATRFHATVLPLRMGIPTFGIAYYRKAKELLDDVGLTECYVDIEDFSEQELHDKYEHFHTALAPAFKSENACIVRYQKELKQQWDTIINLAQ